MIVEEQKERDKGKILVVEDDAALLDVIVSNLQLEPSFAVFGAVGGMEGLAKAQEIQPDLIISDYRMDDMDGFELCQKVKQTPALADTIFILLTAATGTEQKIQGLDLGADDYLRKPYDYDELISKVKAFLRIKTLQDELQRDKMELAALNEQLERSCIAIINLLTHLIELRIPNAAARSKRIADVARWIAERLDVEKKDIENITIAALLHELGKIGIPDHMLKPLYEMTNEEFSIFQQYPVLGQLSLEGIERLREASIIIRHHLENVDGTGYPDRLRNDEIPLGSRILRVLVEFETLIAAHTNLTPQQAVRLLDVEKGRKFDVKVIELLREYVEVNQSSWSDDKIHLSVFDLKGGMVLARDLRTSKGIKLLPKGYVIRDGMIERILNHHKLDPIVSGVYVFRSSVSGSG